MKKRILPAFLISALVFTLSSSTSFASDNNLKSVTDILKERTNTYSQCENNLYDYIFYILDNTNCSNELPNIEFPKEDDSPIVNPPTFEPPTSESPEDNDDPQKEDDDSQKEDDKPPVVKPPVIEPSDEEDSSDLEGPITGDAYANEILALVNMERNKMGLKSLSLHNDLNRVAMEKSEDMASNNYFSHTSPTYGSPFEMMNEFGIYYSAAGENIAMGQTSAEEVMESWMNSDGHRANILNPSFEYLGVGYVENSNGTPYWTQMFISK